MRFKNIKLPTLEEDQTLIKAILEKEQDSFVLANKLSEKFTQRYGFIFGGKVEVRYDLINEKWEVKTSDKQNASLEDIEDLPRQMRTMIEEAKRKRILFG